MKNLPKNLIYVDHKIDQKTDGFAKNRIYQKTDTRSTDKSNKNPSKNWWKIRLKIK